MKKDEGQGKEKCHTKSMMSKEANERLKRDTQHVSFRHITEEKVREMGLKTVTLSSLSDRPHPSS
jgi:hypothetical protein